MMATLHATSVAIGGRAVLLRGAPGAGKSDLAFRLIERGAVLVADDQVEIQAAGGVLLAAPPAGIAGLIELRGLGITRLPFVAPVPVALVVDLVEAPERLPEPRLVELAGIAVPLLEMRAFDASTPAKLLIALDATADEGDGTLYRGLAMCESDRTRSLSEAVDSEGNPRILLVTGMSGAGRSTALKILEDIGYEAVDNLPLSLLPRLAGRGAGPPHPIAVGIDVRTRDFAADSAPCEFARLAREEGLEVSLIFLDCEDEVLARRYTETRRRHPLAGDRPVMDGIRLERARLAPWRLKAGLVIDTSETRTADLKRILAGHFALDAAPALRVFVTSFAYRRGLPRDADLVFDVRFLANPFYEKGLDERTGLDHEVAAFIAADPLWPPFFEALTGLLGTLLPGYAHEGKSYLTLAIGCTGGHHRSVFAAERLTTWLSARGYSAVAAHRDIGGPANPNRAQEPARRPAGCDDLSRIQV